MRVLITGITGFAGSHLAEHILAEHPDVAVFGTYRWRSRMGVGAGIALNPMLIVAMTDVEPERSGLASGLVNTSFMMGGALGLAVLASLAAARTGDALAAGVPQIAAPNDGYHTAFAIGAAFAFGAALLGYKILRIPSTSSEQSDGYVHGLATSAD